uniref:M16 family metallopeptidase n=1 Tax=Pararhizobium sp. IMCC3301 TaxID=3067904 RepID=UPI002741BA0B|nr:pitrilysin family protein [Pararhizobium sp. IMCC3301]
MFKRTFFVKTLLICALTLLAASFLIRPSMAVTVQDITTPKGLNYWLVEDETVPLITVSFSFTGGSVLDPADKQGLADLLSATLDEGAGDLDSQAFQARLEETAVRLSFNSRAERFSGVMRTLSANQAVAFDLLGLALSQPRFDEEPVQRMVSRLQARLRGDLTDADSIAAKTWFATAFAGHPYGAPDSGTIESLGRITGDDLRQIHGGIFKQNGLKLAVVGDIDAATASKFLDATFGALPQGEVLPKVAAPASIAGDTLFIPLDKPQTTIRMGGNSILVEDPDFITAYVVNHILGGGSFTSRLYREVREKRGLAYSVFSYLSAFDEQGFFFVGVGTRSDRAAEVKDVIIAELERMAEEGPSKAELRSAKDYLKGAYALRFDTSDKIATQLVGLQIQGRDINYINVRNEMIESVSQEDAKRVAKRIFSNPLLTIMVGQPPVVQSSEDIKG